MMAEFGGDVVVAGQAPDGVAWRLGIEDPVDPAGHCSVVRLARGSLVTSSQRKRRWATLSGDRHHLIDPRTHTSESTSAQTVSVIAAAGARGEPCQIGIREGCCRVFGMAAAGRRCRPGHGRHRCDQHIAELKSVPVSDPHIWWYVTRASAIIAWILLTLAVVGESSCPPGCCAMSTIRPGSRICTDTSGDSRSSCCCCTWSRSCSTDGCIFRSRMSCCRFRSPIAHLRWCSASLRSTCSLPCRDPP